MNARQLIKSAALILCAVALLPQSASAYVGPGAGLSAIGALLAVVAGIVVAIFGFVWYPIKRIMRKMKSKNNDKQEEGQV